MKHFGKITALTVILMAILFFTTAVLTRQADAATLSPANEFSITNSAGLTYDSDTYILLFDIKTGDFVPTAGTAPVASTTWANAHIATANHAEGINTLTWVATIPQLDKSYQYAMIILSGTSYDNTDTIQAGPFLYDPATNQTYTDTNNQRNGSIFTQTVPR